MIAILEVVRLTLRPGVVHEAFLAASERFSAEVAPFVPGMQRRELCRTGEGEYLLVVRFASERDRAQMSAFASARPAAAAFSALIDMGQIAIEVHEIAAEYADSGDLSS